MSIATDGITLDKIAPAQGASPTVAYLNANWLDDDSIGAQVIGNQIGQSSNCITTYPGQTTWYYWPTSYEPRKIRLTLSDVEHMRKVAANDAKLKRALQKLAPHIEVEVDFP